MPIKLVKIESCDQCPYYREWIADIGKGKHFCTYYGEQCGTAINLGKTEIPATCPLPDAEP